jgi:hypothetical protein
MFWIFKCLNISNLFEIAHLLRPLDLNGWTEQSFDPVYRSHKPIKVM